MAIITGTADVTGLQNSFVLELPGCEFWATQPELHPQMFIGDVHGGTLDYSRELFAEGFDTRR